MSLAKAEHLAGRQILTTHLVKHGDDTTIDVQHGNSSPCDPPAPILDSLCPSLRALGQDRWPMPDIEQEHATPHQMGSGNVKHLAQSVVVGLVTDDMKEGHNGVKRAAEPRRADVADLAAKRPATTRRHGWSGGLGDGNHLGAALNAVHIEAHPS